MKGKKNEVNSSIDVVAKLFAGNLAFQIKEIAVSLSTSEHEFANRIRDILFPIGVGVFDSMRVLRSKSPKVDKKLGRKMAMGSRSRKSKALGGSGSAQKAYWAAMSPLQRKREMARRVAKRKEKKAA